MSWKVLENSVLMSVQSGYRFSISNPGIFVTEHVHYAVLITVSVNIFRFSCSGESKPELTGAELL